MSVEGVDGFSDDPLTKLDMARGCEMGIGYRCLDVDVGNDGNNNVVQTM